MLSEDAEDPTSPEQELACGWPEAIPTRPQPSDENTTSDESDSGSHEGDEDDNLELPPQLGPPSHEPLHPTLPTRP